MDLVGFGLFIAAWCSFSIFTFFTKRNRSIFLVSSVNDGFGLLTPEVLPIDQLCILWGSHLDNKVGVFL